MNSSKIRPFISHNGNSSGSAKKRVKIRFFCPYCQARYEFSQKDLGNDKPKCIHCDEYLQEEAATVRELKCLDCLMAFQINNCLWCLKFRGVVNEEMAQKCEDFISNDILQAREGDRNEGENFQDLGQ